MKNTEEKEPLFKRVPEEMLVEWEKQNLAGQSITSLDGACKRIKALHQRVRVVSISVPLLCLLILTGLFGFVKPGDFMVYPLLATALGLMICLMIGAGFIGLRSSGEVDILQDLINLFEAHFNELRLDDDPIQKVWDKESRLDQLLHITKSVLYYQEHKIPLARKDDRVSINKLVDMIDYYRFLKSHSKEYRLGLQRFGAYFNVPDPRALYDKALSDGMDEIIKIFGIIDGFGTDASSKK